MSLRIVNKSAIKCSSCYRVLLDSGNYVTHTQMTDEDFEKYKDCEYGINGLSVINKACKTCDSQRLTRLRLEIKSLNVFGLPLETYVLK